MHKTTNTQIIESYFRIDLNPSKAVLTVTETVDALLGFSAADFLCSRVRLQELVHPHDQDIADDIFSAVIKPFSTFFNIRLRHADGHIICIKGQYAKSIQHPDGSLVLELMLQDAKSLWREQQNQPLIANFKAMMDNTDDYIYFKDRNHVFTGASQTLVSITDPSEHWTDLLGQTDYDVFPEKFADIYYSLEKQVFAGVHVAHEVQETLDNDGNKGWVDNRKYPMHDDHGAIIGLFGIARDITKSKLVEESLMRSETKFRTLFNSTGDAVLMLDEQGFFDCNQAALALFGIQSKEILHQYSPADLSPPAQLCGTDSKLLAKHYIDAAIQKGTARFEWQHQRADNGKIFTADISLSSLMLDGKLVLQTTVRDISERKEAESKLKIAAIAFESQEGMLVTDASGVILSVNHAFTKITGYDAAEVIGDNPRLLKSTHHDADFYVDMWQKIINNGVYEGEVWNRRKNGEIYPEQLTITAVKDDAGNITHYVGAFIDITCRKATEARIGFLANHDRLTELPNRELFYDRLSQAISQARRTNESIALLFLDLDGFKPVNDAYGHEAGDVVLKVVAKRLQASVRQMDTVARIGGDEFAVILGSLQNPLSAEVIAQKIIDHMVEVIKLNALTACSVGISIGIAIYPDNGTEIDMLMNAADSAMYASKAAGKNTYTLSTLQSQAHTNAPWIPLDAIPRLGVPTIDEQHLKLVGMLNVMNDAIKHKQPMGKLVELLEDLISFTAYHFETEEQLMNACGYLGEIEHKNAHEHLLHEVAYLKTQFIQGGDLVFLQKLKDWFTIHITNADKPLADFILQHGAK